MDMTKKYIEMCIEASEIQELWKPHKGDFWAYNTNFESDLSIKHGNFATMKGSSENWIPRQDQLQELAWNTYMNEDNIDHLLMRFHIDTEQEHETYYMIFRTLEQRWLAFVMCTKYYKKWNSKTKRWEKNDKIKSNRKTWILHLH